MQGLQVQICMVHPKRLTVLQTAKGLFAQHTNITTTFQPIYKDTSQAYQLLSISNGRTV